VVSRAETAVGSLKAFAADRDALGDDDRQTLELLGGLLEAQLVRASRSEEGQQSSRRDPLTGLGNVRAYEEYLVAECSRSRRHDQPLTLCLLDLDGFGLLNERRGRSAGDEVLREVARILSRLRAEDAPFRIGSDEFAVVLPDTSARQARIAVERLGGEIAARIEGGVTASSGLADWPLEPEGLHDAANSLLQQAKHWRMAREEART
jgi:diguanylate cyclase (GGDEF)-like protein